MKYDAYKAHEEKSAVQFLKPHCADAQVFFMRFVFKY